MLLHALGHVDAHHRLAIVEQELGERLGELGLADADRAQEHERADRPVRVLKASAGTSDVSSNVVSVPRAAGGAGAAATQVLGSSGELSTQSEKLRHEVDSIIARIRVT